MKCTAIETECAGYAGSFCKNNVKTNNKLIYNWGNIFLFWVLYDIFRKP